MVSPRRLTLLKKGLLLIAVALVYQAILLGVLLRQQKLHVEAQQWVVHTKDVLLQLDKIYSLLQQSQSDLRVHLLGAGERFEKSCIEAGKAATGQVEILAELIKDNPRQFDRLKILRQRVQARTEYNRNMLAQIAAGDREGAIARIKSLEGQQMMEGLATELEKMRQVEEGLDTERREELKRASGLQNTLLLGGLVVNVIGVGLAAVYFSRTIGQRLEVLTDNMGRIGRSEPLVSPVKGTDEIAAIDAGLHRLALELDAMKASERQSQVTLERRNLELTRANRDLDHKNQENEMFVYSVSHDLRSPLVNLQGFSKELGLVREDLQQLFTGALDENARERGKVLVERDIGESVHYIQTAVMRLSAIIDALLRLSRAGRVEYCPEYVELKPVVQRIVSAMRATIEQKGTIVKVQELPRIWGDPTAIDQVFANLIGNAVNYLDPARQGLIEVSQVLPPPQEFADMVVLAVKDNGLGIPEQYIPKVFNLFQRLHPDRATGEGIGLPLVRRMVERHGGKVWLESVPGVGTTFFVALPRKEHSPLVVAPKKESIRFRYADPK